MTSQAASTKPSLFKRMNARRASLPGMAPQSVSLCDLNMLNPGMPNDQEVIQSEAKDTLVGHDDLAIPIPLNPRKTPNLGLDLKVQIPKRRKVAILEVPNPRTQESIMMNYTIPEVSTPACTPMIKVTEIWKQTQKVVVSAFHPSFNSKYSVKVDLLDENSKSLGVLETEQHQNPGNYCFFCLDYIPENYKMRRGPTVNCVTPYCSCFPKTVYDYQAPKSTEEPREIGTIKNSLFSKNVKLYNKEGELAYKLDNGNSLMRKFRCLLEAPFLMFCLPYKMAICCCSDSFWTGKSRDIKLFDQKNQKEITVGVVTNRVERANAWQEVVKDGEKVNQYKGEEVFLSKQFEVMMPAEADSDMKKLIVGALIADIPSSVDRCAC